MTLISMTYLLSRETALHMSSVVLRARRIINKIVSPLEAEGTYGCLAGAAACS